MERVNLNAKDHLVLPVGPTGPASKSSKRRARRNDKSTLRELERAGQVAGYIQTSSVISDPRSIGQICPELNKGLKNQARALRDDIRAATSQGRNDRQVVVVETAPPTKPYGAESKPLRGKRSKVSGDDEEAIEFGQPKAHAADEQGDSNRPQPKDISQQPEGGEENATLFVPKLRSSQH